MAMKKWGFTASFKKKTRNQGSEKIRPTQTTGFPVTIWNHSLKGSLIRSMARLTQSVRTMKKYEIDSSPRIIGPSYRGVWICIAGFRDLQTPSFDSYRD